MTWAVLAAVALAASGPPPSNQLVLTPRESRGLVAWSQSLRACLARHGVDAGKPEVTRRQIALTVDVGRDVMRATIRCGEALGDPPSGSSLQTFGDRIVLYLPTQCLIDKKVSARN